MKHCENCGEKFISKHMGRRRKFCSDQCRRDAHNAQRAGYSTAKSAKKKIVHLVPKTRGSASTNKTQAWADYVILTWPLDGVERRLLRLAVDCWDAYLKAKAVLDAEGFTLPPARRGGQPKQRPEVRISERARTDFARLLAQLNLAHAGDPEEFLEDKLNDA